MKYLEYRGRTVYPITSGNGQKDYYEHLNYWRVCYQNNNPLILPSQEDVQEYMRLRKIENTLYGRTDKEARKMLLQFRKYDSQYDWRPRKSGDDKFVGLISPTGEQLLPDSYADVFTQFDAINNKPIFVPVSNGEAWALVSLSDPHILMTDFQYNAIIPERWGRRLFFVQDNETMKWGAFAITYPFIHKKPYGGCLPLLKILMPPIADEIYEDELMTEEEPTTFFMTRRGDKIGILTDFGYSDIIYNRYEADNTKCSFRLIRNDRKRAHRADYWHPDGKGLPANLRRNQTTRKKNTIMTFEDFKALALNPPYIDGECVYRVDVHRYVKQIKGAKDVTEFEVKLCQSFMYTDWQRVQKLIPQFIHHERYNEHLYALYVYQLPLNCDVSRDQYQRLWVYDRKGNLNARSMCSALIEELNYQSAKFRGHDSSAIQFKLGDIVEVYDREKGQVRLGVVVKQPPTIEQCWEMRKEVEKACIAEGVGVDNTDNNYWLYATDDCYCVVYDPDCELSYPRTTDVFALMYPILDRLNRYFDTCYQLAVAKHDKMITNNKITEETTIKRIQGINRLVDLI